MIERARELAIEDYLRFTVEDLAVLKDLMRVTAEF